MSGRARISSRGRRVLRLSAFVAASIIGTATLGWALAGSDAAAPVPFPHQAHAHLFPECQICHAGIPTEDSTARFPSGESCALCHDGIRSKRVEWNGASPPPSNLAFSHATHTQQSTHDSTSLTCAACHSVGDTTAFMAVDRASAERCLACHVPRASAHLAATTRCSKCHVSLVRATALSDSSIAAFPRPPDHRAPRFLSQHAPRSDGDALQCATCHARESCARCHPNSAEVSRIAALAPDARVARLRHGDAPTYFTPASHARPEWEVTHGDSSKAAPASCANCHAQPSCRTCHIGGGAARSIARLARPDPNGAAGVRLSMAPLASPMIDADRSTVPAATVAARAAGAESDTTPHAVRVHAADFVRNHGPSASSGQLNCLSCHQERSCTSCHAGASRRRFHAINFASRHAASAAGRETECASCHTTETFCRECHRSQGLASRGGRELNYHDRQPNWLQQHGQAARQEMQSCVTCHQQRDCMRCHSDLGLHVNPHGPGFDAVRMQKRNPQLCLSCHLTDPLQSRPR